MQAIELDPPVIPVRRGHLLRVFGTAFALAIGIGTTIGGGILHSPGDIAALLPTATLFMAVWAFGGINSLLGATVYSELGTMMPQAGGPYVFARRALGGYAGFFVGYTYWIQDCATDAALLLLIGEYLPVLIPALAGHTVAVAFAILVVLVASQWRDVRWSGHIQTTTTIAKVGALGLLVVAAFILPHPAVVPAAGAAAVPHGIALCIALVLAMQGVIFTYNGYFYVIFFGEELRDPGRGIPRSMFRALYLIIAVYLLLNAAFLWVLPISRMAHDPFVGGSVAQALFGERGNLVITAIVIVSVIGTTNSGVLSTARLLLAMGRDGLFVRQATTVNAGGTPTVAVLLSTLVTAAFLLSGTFVAVLAVVAVFVVVNSLLMFASLIALRRREPDTPRPYRAWGYPWTTALAVLIALMFLVGVALADARHGMIALVFLVVSYPLYRLTLKWMRADPAAPW